MKHYLPLIYYLVLIWFLFGCAILTKGVDGEQVPTPQPGTGNLMGQIQWNSVVAADIHVELCERHNFLNGCSGTSYAAATDHAGVYLFANIPPGTYYIAIRLFNTDDWTYISEGFLSAKPFTIAEGATTRVETENIHKLDVKPTHPIEDFVQPGSLTLSWRPYENAAYYQVILYPAEGESLLTGQRIETTDVTVEIPAQDCDYRWKVEAYNQDTLKIAETNGFLAFEVAGQATSCVLTTIAPPDNVTLESGSNVVLTWEAHPAAATYDILMWNDSLPERPHTLDFVGTAVPTYHFGQTLEPGRYVWSVRAFDENGKHIAGSEVSDFTVLAR